MIKILVHCSIYFDGTSFYRGLGPFSHLRKKYSDIEIVDGSTENSVYDWAKILQADILFMQRPSQAFEVQIIKLAKSAKIPIICDWDDIYTDIPKTNPRHDLYMNETRQALIKECLELADVITVSTPAIAEAYGQIVSKDKIVVVPNGYDELLFNDEPYLGERQKIICWRGGDTHEADLLSVKDQILRLIKNHPNYKWAFIGYTPRWLTENLEIPQDQILLFTFQDVMQYFDSLMTLRPEIAIVPLEENQFNYAKSNISSLEFTLAGAITIAPNWDKFRQTGCIGYEETRTFEECVELIINSNDDQKWIHYANALDSIRKFSLSEVNKIRYNIITTLMNTESRKFHPDATTKEPMTDHQYYEYCLKTGLTQENENYAKTHHKLADWLRARLSPDTAVDFGCGPGAVMERLLQNNVKCFGLDKNEHFIEYFRTRNPVHEERINQMDFRDQTLETDKPFDLAISINAFENIDKSEIWWEYFIQLLSTKFRYFYFASSPFSSGMHEDQRLSRVNIRRVEKWRELFEDNGWKYLENPNQIAHYDQLFESQAPKAEMTVQESC